MKDRLLPFLVYRKVRINYVLPYAFLFLITVSGVGLVASLAQPQVAQATTPKIIYYQGKISKTSDGTNIANGNYSMRFKLYTTLGSGTPPTGGSLLWTETWDGASGTTQVAFVNGLFSVALGTYTSLSSVDFTTGALYLSVDFNPGAGYDGEMAPRQQLTAAPFAISANGVSGDGTVNSTVASTTALTVANAGANYALQVDTNTGSSVTGLKVTSAASGGGIALATISSATDEAMTLNAKGAGTISIGTAAGSTGDILFGGGSGSTGCTVTNSTGAFACTAGGSFTTLVLTGAVTGATSYNGLVVTANTGVVTTGTWNGTAVDVAHGGTGNSTYAGTNGVIYYDGSKFVGTAASTGTQCLQTATSGSVPIWGSCGGGGATLNGISAATGNQTGILNANNTIVWNWALTGASNSAFTIGESAAAANGAGSQNLVNLSTLATSTATPLSINNVGTADALKVLSANASGTNVNGVLVNQTGAGTLTNGLNITQTSGAITNGLTFTGTFTKLINSTNFNVTNTGALTMASNLSLSGTTPTLGSTGANSLSIDAGTSGQLNLNGSSSGDVLIAGGSSSSGCTITNSTGALACTANITGGATGTVGYWTRAGTSLAPATSNDVIAFSIANNTIGLNITTAASTANTTTAIQGTTGTSGTAGTQNAFLASIGAVSSGGTTNGLNFAITNPSGGTLNGFNFPAISGGGATVNALNVGNLTAGSGVETALNVGTGWDSGFNILSGGNLIKSSSLNAFQIQNSSGLSIDNINTAAGAGFANLIYNSSFEQNIHNWNAKGVPTLGPVWDNAAGNAKYGYGTLKFTGSAAGQGAQYNFPFAPSTTYSVSFWAKTASGTATLRLDRQDNGSDVGGCTDSALTTTWTQFTCTFTTGGTINTSTSNLFFKQNAVGTPTVFIDGLAMTLGSTVMSYSMPGNNIQVDADYSNITLNAGQNPDIQPWQLNSNALPSGRRSAESVTANGFAYFVGGTTANGSAGAPVTTVNYAAIKADGSVSAGAWSAAANTLPVALYGSSTFVANGYLYIVGGCSDSSVTAACTTPVSTVYYSKLNSDGTTGVWQTNANTLPAARGFGAAVFANGFVYYFGGYNATAQTTVYSARLSADGTVSAWTTTGVTALGTGRYGQTTLNANGKIYSIGGCSDAGALCNTAVATVEYATPALDGTLGAWSAATSLPVATGFHSTAILNGNIFNYGGRQASATVAAVYYAKINSVGPLGAWYTSAYPLPAVRQQSTSLFVNSYLYNLGGYDGTTTLPTSIHFASGPRVLVFGGLDLVSLNAQTLTDYAGGGTLTAGNTRVVGDLRIDGFADLNNGLSVDSAINLNAVSASAGQNIFNINNLNSNSIFNVRHMSTNFGSLVTAGAFMQKNSYWGEEFNNGKLTACAPVGAAAGASINAWARGDGGGQGAAAACSGTANATVNGGELSASTATGGTTTFGSCTFASPGVTTANGVERITATSVNTVGSTANCVENLGGTTTTSNKIYLAANLPVITMKVKPSTLPAATAGARVQIGLMSGDSASGSGVNSPTQAIYFTNCSTWTTAAVPTGCSNTTWYGVTATAGASAATVVTCSVGSGSLTAAFSYLRIEVRSSTDVHFFADYNTTDGINESECGTGSATNITASALTPWMQAIYNAQAAATTALDIDYFRGWQDDNVTPGQDSVDQTAPVTLDPATETSTEQQAGFDARTLLAKFMAMTEPESLEAQTQKIDTGILTASSQIVTPTITANGLHIDSITAIGDMISFMSDVSFIGRPYFNTDTAGFAQVSAGDNQVVVKFDSPYLEQPIVNVGISQDANVLYKTETDPEKIKQMQADQEQAAQELFSAGIQFLVINKNENGFTILLSKPAPKDMVFNWVALAVKGAKTAVSTHSDSSNNISQSSSPDSGTVAGYSTGPDASTLVSDTSSSDTTPPQGSSPQPETPTPPDSAPVSTSDLSQ